MACLWYAFLMIRPVNNDASILERDAMGDDEYHPISHKGSNLTSAGGVGYTVIDSIDTMLLMGLTTEYARARAWVADKLSFKRDGDFNTFEVCRVLKSLIMCVSTRSYCIDNYSCTRRPPFRVPLVK